MNDLDSMAKILTESGHYKVLRRLAPRQVFEKPDGSEQRTGLLVDVETTGLDSLRDEIIEIAMVPFTYSTDGRIFEVKPEFQSFQEPSKPITPEITALTGITNEMVAGHTIDLEKLKAFAAGANIVIAHNAAFDRRFLEKLSDVFVAKPWACSMSQIDWAAEGFEGTKLAYLAMGAGFFYDKHRAVNDCAATIELLATTLPKSGERALSALLANARRTTWRIWAENSPFDQKDVLKARGYRWNGDARVWCVDIDEDAKEGEMLFLKTEVYKREVNLRAEKITAFERFK